MIMVISGHHCYVSMLGITTFVDSPSKLCLDIFRDSFFFRGFSPLCVVDLVDFVGEDVSS